ncbi:MAG: bacillithiol system redox-active protein YtxJ [Planctomycetes bacterium]|nr:bacillithiol system redox-active protein YtxJ [Planctomycetota bacterium]HPF14978.1 bacillithiol system redox-active protein YtxJ [Planctomycetota bacterium]
MHPQAFELPIDPEAALAELRHRSQETPVWVFKQSPICPISHRAQAEFEAWVGDHSGDPVAYTVIDVIAQRTLARGLTAALGIQHESPQALYFQQGELAWHGSHGQLTQSRFAQPLGDSGLG